MIRKNCLALSVLLGLPGLSLAEGLPAVSFDPSAFLQQARVAVQEAPAPKIETVAVPDAAPSAKPFTLPEKTMLVSEARISGSLLGSEDTKLRITANGQTIGTLVRELIGVKHFVSKALGWRPRLTVYLKDGNGNDIAYAKSDLISYTYTVHVMDKGGQLIGTFKSDLLQEYAEAHSDVLHGDLSKYASFYGIYDKDDKLIGRSVKSQDPTGMDFHIHKARYDADGDLTGFETENPVAHITKSPEWLITVNDPSFVVPGQAGMLDPRLVVMIPAFQNFVSKERTRGLK
jgi:hypothetical protein